MRIAATGDIHVGLSLTSIVKDALTSIGDDADILVIAGDLTDHGMPQEMDVCLEALAKITVPVVAVLGNHDYESGLEWDLIKMLLQAGIHLLDGTTFEVNGIGFAGTKGFCGGFHPHQLTPFGESSIKTFVDVSEREAEKLNDALASLKARRRVAVMHYAPIQATVRGEPESIFPFLGSSRLERSLDLTFPDLALHGHAHRGSFEGRTTGGVRVCNVSLPLLRGRCRASCFTFFDL